MNKLSERLKNLRILHEWTQQNVADEIGVNKQTISQYERGVREPQIDILEELAVLFGVDIDFLVGSKDYVVCRACNYVFDPLNLKESHIHDLVHQDYLNVNKRYWILSHLLQKNNESLDDLSTNLNVPLSVFSSWKKDSVAPSVKYIEKIADHFNIPKQVFYHVESVSELESVLEFGNELPIYEEKYKTGVISILKEIYGTAYIKRACPDGMFYFVSVGQNRALSKEDFEKISSNVKDIVKLFVDSLARDQEKEFIRCCEMLKEYRKSKGLND